MNQIGCDELHFHTIRHRARCSESFGNLISWTGLYDHYQSFVNVDTPHFPTVDLVAAHPNGLSSAGVLWGYGSRIDPSTGGVSGVLTAKAVFSQQSRIDKRD